MQLKRLILSILSVVAAAQAQDVANVHFIKASGVATIKVKPDQAEISIGVVTQAASAQAASAQNAAQTAATLAAVKNALGTLGEIQTSGYSVSPQFEYRNGLPPKITGYQTSNTVLVRVNDTSLAGKIIDAANAAGANNIIGISFSVRDESAVRNQALAEAAGKARSSAEAIAKALDATVLGVFRAETTEAPEIRLLRKNFAMATPGVSSSTPIESGDVEIQATVTVSLLIR